MSSSRDDGGEPIAGTAEVLLGYLSDPVFEVRHSAAFCLTGLGAAAEPAIPALIAALSDPH